MEHLISRHQESIIFQTSFGRSFQDSPSEAKSARAMIWKSGGGRRLQDLLLVERCFGINWLDGNHSILPEVKGLRGSKDQASPSFGSSETTLSKQVP